MNNKRIRKVTALFICLIMFLIPVQLTVASSPAADTTFKPLTDTSKSILYESKAIINTDLLISRAKLGIDEFKDDTGMKVAYANNSTADVELEAFHTSQLIGEVVENGQVLKEYAVTYIVRANDYDEHTNGSVSKNGCTIKTTAYMVWNSNLMRVSFRFSKTTVSNGSPTGLTMVNKVYEGFDTNRSHVNSNSFPIPSGIYSLTSPYTGEIGDSFACSITSTGIVYFSDGTNLTSEVTVNPNQ